MRRYLALELPSPVRNLIIKEDLDFQIRQRELFRLRVKLGPDFINCNGRKQIIEFFGCWYHSCPIHHPEKKVDWQETEIGKKVIFSRYGFNTLVIWEHELSDEKAIVGKVSQFMARTLCFK